MALTAYMIKKFGVMSLAKFCMIFGFIWGFFMGLAVAFGAKGIAATMGLGSYGTGIGIVGFIVTIVVGGILGFFGGALLAIVYNVVLGAIGGIEMDLELKT